MKLDHSYFTFSQKHLQITSNGGVADQVQDGITTFFGSSGVVMMYDRIRYMHDSIDTYILSILNGCGNSISVACEIIVFPRPSYGISFYDCFTVYKNKGKPLWHV